MSAIWCVNKEIAKTVAKHIVSCMYFESTGMRITAKKTTTPSVSRNSQSDNEIRWIVWMERGNDGDNASMNGKKNKNKNKNKEGGSI